MTDEILFENEWVTVVLRDGWYTFARGTHSDGVVYVLPFRSNKVPYVLGRFEVTPAHSPDKKLTCITGGIPPNVSPAEVAITELWEEAGFRVKPDQLWSLGTCHLSKMTDTVAHLFAVNVTGLSQHPEPIGDGTKGEEGSYVAWVDTQDVIECDEPVMSMILMRTGLDRIHRLEKHYQAESV